MGTQFWWFFDVIIVSIAFGVFYSAVSRGIRKGLFSFVSLALAVVLGWFGSQFLTPRVYEELFQDSIRTAVSNQLQQEEWDIYGAAADSILISQEDADWDEEEMRRIQEKAEKKQNTDYDERYITAISNAAEAQILTAKKPHSTERLQTVFKEDHDAFYHFLEYLDQDDPDAAAALIEVKWYHSGYQTLVRCALFLLIEILMLIISGIISSMNKHDEDAEVGKADRLLAVPVGLVEACCYVLIAAIAVQFLVVLTDSQMLLFNSDTIQKTRIFRYIYDFVSNF